MRITTYIITIFLGVFWSAQNLSAETPWRAQSALNLPAWLSLSGSFRLRYESLDEQFRAGRTGGDQMLALRTTLKAVVGRGSLKFGGELLDSRAALDDRGTPINTTHVNPVELLQAYAHWRAEDLLQAGASNDFRVGRITMDVGSRRFVARNRYRNTINAFTGFDWQWRSASGRELRAFFTLPIDRQPNNAAALRKNHVEFDNDDDEVKFWGLFFADTLGTQDRLELFYFGLDEDDTGSRRTRNRELSTLGFRLFRKPVLQAVDYTIESAVQFGESRSSTATTDTRDLDHLAHFHHVEIGYSFDRPWHLRLVAQYDYASGDDSPNDGENERFDTLFGARRFDFGPTGIYGPFARSNLSTPGVRLQIKPLPKVSSFIAYRAYWLASDRDAWTTTGVRDASGNSDSFIGHQVELRVRYELVPKNIRLEGGVAQLFDGEFARNAPNSNRQGDSTYLYTQMALAF